MLDNMYELLAAFGFKDPLHPPITHMPIGLAVGAAIFFLAAVIYKRQNLILTARHVSILSFIFAFPTIMFGVMDWIHFYHAALFTPIIIKMVLAAVLLTVLGAGIILGSEIRMHETGMIILYMIALGAVSGLGYYGSQIIYGRGLEVKTGLAGNYDSPLILPVFHATAGNEKIGFEEKLGSFVPHDTDFMTESGVKIRFGDMIKGPTILSIVYYRCPNACDWQLTSIAAALRPYADTPGTEPTLVSVTIDERETPLDAMKAKKIAYESIERPFPSDKWHFLTGNLENIKKLTDAVGYRFIRKGNDFDHPLGIIILSPDGKVVRYMPGVEYLPIELKMALLEASSGIVKPTIARVVRYCFSYNPRSHQMVFNTLRVSATVIFILVGAFAVYLIVSGKKRRKAGGR
jgi:protein SCO1